MMSGQRLYKDQSRRLQSWDYSTPSEYFVTICTQYKAPHFGIIDSGVVKLTTIGEIVAQEWEETGNLRENVQIDEFVVMPNHLHGILFLLDSVGTPRRGVHKSNALTSGSLGSIIGQYKSTCTRRIRATTNRDFAWQSRYYDHVIRDERDHQRIRKYIRENPSKWSLDKYYCEHFEESKG
jgi:putative transposase